MQSSILIVDDEQLGREILGDLLRPSGYHIMFAANGPDALDQAIGNTPDLVLLDVMLPGMDGFTVCEQLRNHPQTAEVPVIMVTALDDRESRLRGIQVGADDFLSKPIDRLELQLRVRTTTRLNRYRQLQNERSHFQHLVELSPDGITILDNAGIIRLANPAMLSILGIIDTADVLDHPLLSFVPIQQRGVYDACLGSLSGQAGGTVRIETMLVRTDRTLVVVEINGAQITWQDQPAIQMIVRDITERRRLIQALADREQRLHDLVEKLLLSQEEERRRIAYELHDGLAQVAASAHQHLQTFAQRYHASDIHMARELDKAMDLSQRVVKETRQVIAGLRPTVLDDFGLASALRIEIESLRESGWDVRYEESTSFGQLPAVVETTFFRVAQEAITNIRKHAQTTALRLALRYDETSIHLEVQDWGCGFDPQIMADTHTSGSRVGLASMQERMAMLGGGVHISSDLGKGTLIIAEAPLALSPQSVLPKQVQHNPAPVASGHRARLIIADDHDLARAGLRSALEGERDIEVVGEARNGHEALELCHTLLPDLALIDVRMPEMDGLRTTRAIKSIRPEISVIIVTMHENADYLLAAVRAGAAGYLLKDAPQREIVLAIRHVLRGESFLNTELTRRLLNHISAEADKPESPGVEPLTPRECDVLKLLVQGQTNREIAANLMISALTVKVHVQHIIAKLGVSDRTQAAVRATEMGLLQ